MLICLGLFSISIIAMFDVDDAFRELFFYFHFDVVLKFSLFPQHILGVSFSSGPDRARRHCWISIFRTPLGKWIARLQIVVPSLHKGNPHFN